MAKEPPAGLRGLSDFKPKTETQEETMPPVNRAAAEAHGFTNRNPVRVPKKYDQTDVPMHSFTARITAHDATDFIEWCKAERMSYREGFAHLMELLRKHG